MSYLSEENISNALVVQKDRIMESIRNHNLATACEQLNIVSQLWSVLGYGYKINEVRERMSDAAREMIRELDVELCRLRRGSKKYVDTINRIEYLKTFRSY